MPLDVEQGKKMLQLLTSRYDDRHWRKKIERTLSLPVTGVGDDKQRAVFAYLKEKLKTYKSRRADPDSWIVGGYVTKEVIERAKFNPEAVAAGVGKDEVAFLGEDPGEEVDQDWWEDMLVWWFDEPEPEHEEGAEDLEAGADGERGETAATEASASDRSSTQTDD